MPGQRGSLLNDKEGAQALVRIIVAPVDPSTQFLLRHLRTPLDSWAMWRDSNSAILQQAYAVPLARALVVLGDFLRSSPKWSPSDIAVQGVCGRSGDVVAIVSYTLRRAGCARRASVARPFPRRRNTLCPPAKIVRRSASTPLGWTSSRPSLQQREKQDGSKDSFLRSRCDNGGRRQGTSPPWNGFAVPRCTASQSFVSLKLRSVDDMT